jgi:hypothetical protein
MDERKWKQFIIAIQYDSAQLTQAALKVHLHLSDIYMNKMIFTQHRGSSPSLNIIGSVTW